MVSDEHLSFAEDASSTAAPPSPLRRATAGWRAAATGRPLATLTGVRPYLAPSRCRFTYSHSRLVMADGGIGALPNSDSSVSVRPLKQTAYPPNGTLFLGRHRKPAIGRHLKTGHRE